MINFDLKKRLKNRGICIVIPTYNNDKTIESVVKESLLYCDDIIVVADGCTDKTMEQLLHIYKIKVKDMLLRWALERL